jgi:hypothetical protein
LAGEVLTTAGICCPTKCLWTYIIEGVVVDIMKDDATEIAQIQKSNQISLYPNPTNEKFTISNV